MLSRRTVPAVELEHYLTCEIVTSEAPGRHRRWLRRTLDVARRSQHRQPMAAAAVHGGRIVAVAVNSRRNSPAHVEWSGCSRHAEAGLARADIEGATVYVARLRRDGSAGIARPCRQCMATLAVAGARQVVWTAANGQAGMERIR